MNEKILLSCSTSSIIHIIFIILKHYRFYQTEKKLRQHGWKSSPSKIYKQKSSYKSIPLALRNIFSELDRTGGLRRTEGSSATLLTKKFTMEVPSAIAWLVRTTKHDFSTPAKYNEIKWKVHDRGTIGHCVACPNHQTWFLNTICRMEHERFHIHLIGSNFRRRAFRRTKFAADKIFRPSSAKNEPLFHHIFALIIYTSLKVISLW